MTDNQIIKALECCLKGCNTEGCDDCPLYEKVEDCEIEIPIIALDLINRQKAEIERLSKAIKVLNIMEEQEDKKQKKPNLKQSESLQRMSKPQ